MSEACAACDVFTEVFVASGGSVSSTIAVRSLPHMGGGYGVLAKRKMKEDEVGVSVPRSLSLTASYCRKENRLPTETPSIVSFCLYLMRMRLRCIENYLKENDANSELPQRLFPSECLGLSLAHFKTSATLDAPEKSCKRGPRACFTLWVSRLPPQYDNLIEIHPNNSLRIPLPEVSVTSLRNAQGDSHEEITQENLKYFVSDDILDAWTQERTLFASDLYTYLLPLLGSKRHCRKIEDEIKTWRNLALSASTMFPKIPPLLLKALKQRQSDVPSVVRKVLRTKKLLLELFGWAYCTLMSRGFSSDDETWMMIPWVDYFNFSQDPNVWWEENEEQNSFEFKALRNIQAGEELLINYASSSDLDLLTWYGFILCPPLGKSLSLQLEVQKFHQSECFYFFSPLAKANGDYDKSPQWVEEIIGSCLPNLEGIRQLSSVWLNSVSDRTCSINRDVMSVGLYSLVCYVSKASGMLRSLVLTKVLLFELLTFWNLNEEEFQLANSFYPDATTGRTKHHFILEAFPHDTMAHRNCRNVQNDLKSILFCLLSQSAEQLESMLRLHDL